MPLDFVDCLSFAWRFAWHRERIAAFFTYYLAAILSLGLIVLGALAVFAPLVARLSSLTLLWERVLQQVLAAGLFFLLLLLVWAVLAFAFYVLVTALVTKWAAEERFGRASSLGASYAFAKSVFWRVFILIVAIVVISFVVTLPLLLLSFIPFVGLLFVVLRVIVEIVLVLAFAFAFYYAVVRNVGVIDSIKQSIELFLAKPFEVFISILLLVIIAVILLILSLVPAGVGIVALLTGVNVFTITLLVLLCLVSLACVSFVEVFSTGFLTSVFLQLTEKQALEPTVSPRAPRPRAPAKKIAGKR